MFTSRSKLIGNHSALGTRIQRHTPVPFIKIIYKILSFFKYFNRKKTPYLAWAITVPLTFLSTNVVSASTHDFYTKTNLASDTIGIAPTHDPKLVNPWGLSHSPTGPWWISDNNAGSSSIYTGTGTSVAPAVSIPSPTGGANAGTPTGNVFNKIAVTKPQAFVIKKSTAKGPSLFMFATEDGTIAGWNKDVDSSSAILAVNRSAATDAQGDVGAVYKGLAFGSHNGKQYIYATNFRFGTIEMFDENFNLVKSFTDPQLTSTCPVAGQCFAPFGIQDIHGELYVTFALQKPDKHDDQAGAGNGFVDVFSTDGKLQKELITQGNLNSPWGLALAPHDFGSFSNHLLVGNFGDGTISAYDLHSGKFDDKLESQSGGSIQVNGLWGLSFGNNGQAGKRNELFFTAGIGDETHGIFGKITHSEE
jgi:uncharacterized protein (TIGR03118 family)